MTAPTFSLPARRIAIVPAKVANAKALATFVQHNLAHLHTYLPAVAELASLQAATDYLHAAEEWAAEGDVLEWYVFSSATLCGSIRVKDIDTCDRKAKIGYFLGREFEGQGIMTASVRIILDHCFNVLQLNRIELHCAVTNTSSMAVARRLGFTLEGVLRQDECLHGVFVDQQVYGLLRAEFVGSGPETGNVKLLPYS
jgi:ribosomal-protein-serine acetyltransferase